MEVLFDNPMNVPHKIGDVAGRLIDQDYILKWLPSLTVYWEKVGILYKLVIYKYLFMLFSFLISCILAIPPFVFYFDQLTFCFDYKFSGVVTNLHNRCHYFNYVNTKFTLCHTVFAFCSIGSSLSPCKFDYYPQFGSFSYSLWVNKSESLLNVTFSP